MCDDRGGQLRPVLKGEVRALAGRRRKVCGVADQRHARRPRPGEAGGQGMERAQHECAVAVGDQCGERRGPASELGRDPRPGGDSVGEIGRREPIERPR